MPFVQEGVASYYADKFQGSFTAHGEQYDSEMRTASHPKLPLHSMVKVTNLENNKWVVVRINDRFPENNPKAILLSKSAASEIGMVSRGSVRVKIEELVEENTEKVADVIPVNNKVGLSLEEKLQPNYTYNCEGEVKTPKGYTVQLAALSSLKTFKDICGELSKKGGDKDNIYVQVSENDKGKVYRILLGAYEKEEWAREKLKTITESGFKAIVKNHQGSVFSVASK
jgi:rare lipoprotein A